VVAENFIKLINELGPIERTPHIQEKIQGIYDTVNKARVRWVLGATLRRPWEEVYPGNQRNAMAFDKDFLGILKEEWMKARIAQVLTVEKRFFDLKELSQNLKAKKEDIMSSLQEMVKEGVISRVHKEGIAQYIV
jgi:heterodisulfide reductase subunit A